MTGRATTLALLLNILSTPALGDDLVVAAEEESAPTLVVGETETEIETPAPELDVPAEVVKTTDAEATQYKRLFGAPDVAELEKDSPIVAEVRESAIPWWVWPIGILAIGALFLMRGRAHKMLVPDSAIRVVSRQPMGKDGTLALIEVNDGDTRARRLLVGLGGGAPRLVADLSAWDVAVTAPSTMVNEAVAIPGPDPMPENEQVVAFEETRNTVPTPEVAEASPVAAFGAHLYQAQVQDQCTDVDPLAGRAALIEEVLAVRDQFRKDKVDAEPQLRHKPVYSSREIVA